MTRAFATAKATTSHKHKHKHNQSHHNHNHNRALCFWLVFVRQAFLRMSLSVLARPLCPRWRNVERTKRSQTWLCALRLGCVSFAWFCLSARLCHFGEKPFSRCLCLGCCVSSVTKKYFFNKYVSKSAFLIFLRLLLFKLRNLLKNSKLFDMVQTMF